MESRECVKFTCQLEPFEAYCSLQDVAHEVKLILATNADGHVFEAMK